MYETYIFFESSYLLFHKKCYFFRNIKRHIQNVNNCFPRNFRRIRLVVQPPFPLPIFYYPRLFTPVLLPRHFAPRTSSFTSTFCPPYSYLDLLPLVLLPRPLPPVLLPRPFTSCTSTSTLCPPYFYLDLLPPDLLPPPRTPTSTFYPLYFYLDLLPRTSTSISF